MTDAFVPADFLVPSGFEGNGFRLEPLGPEHNDRDYAAWSSSIGHIRATPGYDGADWPRPMSLDANRADLEGHARDFQNRDGFTYSVLVGEQVVGCVYIYPSRSEGHDATVMSWVTESSAEIDLTVWRDVSAWLADEWPFTDPDYAPRE